MTDSDFTAAMQSLGSRLAASDIDRGTYYAALVRLLHERFRPSRVSVWRLEAAHSGSEPVLRCEAAFDPGTAATALGRDILSDAEFRPYLEVLMREGIYVSNDTTIDAALKPMRPGYLIPASVEALMDAAITINGNVVGVICCEEVGRKRAWLRPEVTAMRRSIATVNVHLARLRAEEARASEQPG